MPLLGRGSQRTRSLNRQEVLVPVEGVDFSLPADLIGARKGFGQNMLFYNGLLRKMDGYRKFGTTKANGAIIQMALYETTSGTRQALRMTGTLIERYNTVTGEWDYIHGPNIAATETDFIDFAMCSELDQSIITSKNKSNIKRYAGGQLVDLAGSPGKAGTVVWFSPYAVIGDLEESGTSRPGKVKWCNNSAITDWTGGNAGSKLLAHEPSRVKKLSLLNDECLAYKGGSIYTGRQVSTSEVISWNLLKTDVGLFSSRCLAGIRGQHFFVGGKQTADDFFLNDGIRVESIGRAVRDFVLPRINTSRPDMSWAMVIERLKEVWFHICTVGNDYPTERWRFNYETGFWYFDPINSFTAGLNYQVVSNRTWDQLVGSWNAQTFKWDDRSGSAGAPLQIFGNDVGQTYKIASDTRDFDGVAVDGYFDTSDFTADQRASKKDWLELDLWMKGTGNAKVYYSTDEGVTFTFINSYALYSEFGDGPAKIYFHVKAGKIRFRVRNSDSEGDLVIKAAQPYFLVSEESR